jgi:hypothetical protein
LSAQRNIHRTLGIRISLLLSVPAIAIAAFAAPAGISAAAGQPATSAHSISAYTTAKVTRAAASGTAGLHAVRLAEQTRRHRHLGPKRIAWLMMHRFGWRARHQFRYLNRLWMRESSWNKYATNPYSGAYGIPQAVPGWKMASAGPNWRTNARTQIRWGLRYIKSRYGSPARAWWHEAVTGWY